MVPISTWPTLSKIEAFMRLVASDWLKQPMFVRLFAVTAIPAAKERDVEPENSIVGIDVPNLAPRVRASALTMKRLLFVPPAVAGAWNVTAPPPVYANTVSRKFAYVF